jgi:ABC-2 type transport system permease protein
MGTILTLAAKELRILCRDRFALFWILAFPVIYAVFFGVIFGDSGGGGSSGRISLALVDDDRSELSAALVARLADHESVSVARAGEDGAGEVLLSDLEAAREAVRFGSRTAYVRIPAGYGDEPYALFGAGDGDAPGLELGIDPSRQAEAGFLQGVLMESLFSGMTDRFTDKDAMASDIAKAKAGIADADDLSGTQKLVLSTFMSALGSFLDQVDLDVLEEGGPGGMTDPFEVVDVARERGNQPRSPFDITFPQCLAWGLMGVALGFAVTIVRERTGGTLLRLKIAPISRARLLTGKAVACFVGCLFVMVFLMGFGVAVMGLHIDQPLLMLLPMVCTAICFTGLMMVASVMGKTEQAVAGASWGLMMPFAMIGGGMIPLIAMPEWLVSVSDISFFKWAIYAMEGAVWRGFGLGDMLVPCAALLGFGVVFFAVGVSVFRRLEA